MNFFIFLPVLQLMNLVPTKKRRVKTQIKMKMIREKANSEI